MKSFPITKFTFVAKACLEDSAQTLIFKGFSVEVEDGTTVVSFNANKINYFYNTEKQKALKSLAKGLLDKLYRSNKSNENGSILKAPLKAFAIFECPIKNWAYLTKKAVG